VANHTVRRAALEVQQDLEEDPMTSVPLRLSLVLLALSLAPIQQLYAQSTKPSGKISIESTSIALAVGVNWGEGRLVFKGKRQQLFAVDGLTLVDVGIAKATAVGEVYNLTDISQFEGHYLASEADFLPAGGIGGIFMRNKNGVVLYLRGDSEEAQLQLAPGGVTIKLR
jgi:hypothetical protein